MQVYGIIIFIIGILIISLLSWPLYYSVIDRRVQKNFRFLQERYGFTADYSKRKGLVHYPVSEGTMKSYPVQVGTLIDDNRSKSALTFVNVTCPNPSGMDFQIAARKPASNIMYGKKAQSTGDSEFDEKFSVSSGNNEKMFALLNFSIKYKFLQTANVQFKGILTLNNNTLAYRERGLIADRRDLLRIELLLHLLCEIADGLNSDSESL